MDTIEIKPQQMTQASTDDILDIIQQARTDPEAFRVLYRRYVTQVYRYCLSRTHNVADAEDITSQVFMEVWHTLPRYRHQRRFAAWLFTIARRRLTDFYRKREALTSFDEQRDSDSQPGPLNHVIQTESIAHLNDLVNELPQRQQELVRLRFAGELKYKEIAMVLGKSEASVKMALRRILKRLQAQWGEDYE